MQIYFYRNRKVPVKEFIYSLEMTDQIRILGCLKSIEDLGFDCPRVIFKPIDGKLWEIKINGINSSYRIFYVSLFGNRIVLLHAYKKQSQKAPHKEIVTAKKRLREVVENEADYIK